MPIVVEKTAQQEESRKKREEEVKKMKNKLVLLTALLLLCLVCGEAWAAEHPSAAKYKKMFAAGSFYLEYTTVEGSGKHTYSMVHAYGTDKGKRWSSHQPLRGGNKKPQAMYLHGKFYSFMGIVPKVMSEEQLSNKHQDPQEGFLGIKSRLAYPDALSVWITEDPFDQEFFLMSPPVYKDSRTATINKKEYACDRYVRDITDLYGQTLGHFFYEMHYDKKGELKIIIKSFAEGNKDSGSMTDMLMINKLVSPAPAKLMQFKRTEVFQPGLGDMDDLLDNRLLAEILEG